MDRRTTRPGEKSRIPLEWAVRLRFKHAGDFVDELAADLSTGGMFIRTRRPHPVASVFEFELRPGGDRRWIAGKAQVAWVRRRSDTLDRPAGMGVRFVEVDDESRRHIAELVAVHEAGSARPRGPEAPTLEETTVRGPGVDDLPPRTEPLAPPAAPSAAAVRVPGPPPVAGAAFAGDPPGSARRFWALLTCALVLALAAVFWLRPGPAPQQLAAETAPLEPLPPATESAAADRAGDAGEPAEPDPARAVDDWVRAWSEQRVDDYLAVYSSRFEPPDGLARAAWEGQRRARILAPEWIRIALAFVEQEPAGIDRSRVRFVQIYESDSYRDVVRKVLLLEREGDTWKILREAVEP